MQPCSQLSPADTLSTVSYMTNSSLLLLQASTLLLSISTSTCMDSSRASQAQSSGLSSGSSRWERTPSTERSAYWATSRTQLDTAQVPPPVPSLQLPNSPTYSPSLKIKKKPASLRSLLRRKPEENVMPGQPSSLSPYFVPEPLRSAPPSTVSYPRSISEPPILSRGFSQHRQTPPRPEPARDYGSFEAPRSPRQAQTFPQPSFESFSPQRNAVNTWLEPFDNGSEMHLFAEATSGFAFSPPTHRVAPPPQQSVQLSIPERPLTPSQRLAATIQNVAGDEEDEVSDDDELPDYQQSQAEAHEKKRREAASRAAELERRWASARRG